jgi:nicotinate-nucleotide adenylyltransferase
MRYVIFGGAFNPPHIAHLFMAEMMIKELDYDRVFFIPSNISSHKSTEELIPPGPRMEMLRSLEKEISWMIVDDCEIRRGGVSYTIDTVNDLYSRFNFSEKPGLLIGDDLLPDFTAWKDMDELITLVNLIVVFRTGGGREKVSFPYTRIENVQMDVSSSDIRRRIREGRAFRFMLPETVYTHILQTGLYTG